MNWEWLAEFFVGLLGAVLGTFLFIWLHRRLSRNTIARVIAINPSQKTIIVVPYRKSPQGKRTYITYEDMLAANYAERTLTLAGLSSDKIDIWDERQFSKSSEAKHKNLILICSPRSNPWTRRALRAIKREIPGFDADFKTEKRAPGQWFIQFWDSIYKSKTYAQQAKLVKRGKIPGQGRLEDCALIIRAQNPWNPRRRLLIIAGIRGIGTWGAARYLRDQTKELLDRAHGHDFAAVIRVKYDNYKIPDRTLLEVYPLTGPPPSK